MTVLIENVENYAPKGNGKIPSYWTGNVKRDCYAQEWSQEKQGVYLYVVEKGQPNINPDKVAIFFPVDAWELFKQQLETIATWDTGKYTLPITARQTVTVELNKANNTSYVSFGTTKLRDTFSAWEAFASLMTVITVGELQAV